VNDSSIVKEGFTKLLMITLIVSTYKSEESMQWTKDMIGTLVKKGADINKFQKINSSQDYKPLAYIQSLYNQYRFSLGVDNLNEMISFLVEQGADKDLFMKDSDTGNLHSILFSVLINKNFKIQEIKKLVNHLEQLGFPVEKGAYYSVEGTNHEDSLLGRVLLSNTIDFDTKIQYADFLIKKVEDGKDFNWTSKYKSKSMLPLTISQLSLSHKEFEKLILHCKNKGVDMSIFQKDLNDENKIVTSTLLASFTAPESTDQFLDFYINSLNSNDLLQRQFGDGVVYENLYHIIPKVGNSNHTDLRIKKAFAVKHNGDLVFEPTRYGIAKLGGYDYSPSTGEKCEFIAHCHKS
jgi:hypothetical protein